MRAQGAWCRGHWLWLGHFCWCCPIDEHPSLRGRVWSRSLVISYDSLCILMHCLHMSALCICCVSFLFIFVHCGSLPDSSCPCHTPWSWCNSRTPLTFSQAPVQMLQQAADLLKPGGLIYATHWRPAWRSFDSEFGKILKQKSCHVLSCPVIICHLHKKMMSSGIQVATLYSYMISI